MLIKWQRKWVFFSSLLIQSSPLTYIWAHFKRERGLKGGAVPTWDDWIGWCGGFLGAELRCTTWLRASSAPFSLFPSPISPFLHPVYMRTPLYICAVCLRRGRVHAEAYHNKQSKSPMGTCTLSLPPSASPRRRWLSAHSTAQIQISQPAKAFWMTSASLSDTHTLIYACTMRWWTYKCRQSLRVIGAYTATHNASNLHNKHMPLLWTQDVMLIMALLNTSPSLKGSECPTCPPL